ncbi:MAG TPA: 16S rRNA (uracil(1498)-N(3))-methyltransferase [Hyphomicrobiaceae bacterium]|nr:16S rRNA (uracil(1498)-N(3))-methyltransferase [Hyphomicrobiaceae bacterium]
MARYDFRAQRLYVDAPLARGESLACDGERANYLLNVLRLGNGGRILLFNGREGEWEAEIAQAARRRCILNIIAQRRTQEDGPDLELLFAPLKRARLDYMVQKATELGVGCLRPVLTQRTVPERVNLERMRANAIEAAEQCGILRVPAVSPPQTLKQAMTGWDEARRLIYCDEAASPTSPLAALTALPRGPLAVLIGPEGGFDPDERKFLRAQPFTLAVSLGPRILRADTAAVAALALVNATLGDWR